MHTWTCCHEKPRDKGIKTSLSPVMGASLRSCTWLQSIPRQSWPGWLKLTRRFGIATHSNWDSFLSNTSALTHSNPQRAQNSERTRAQNSNGLRTQNEMRTLSGTDLKVYSKLKLTQKSKLTQDSLGLETQNGLETPNYLRIHMD